MEVEESSDNSSEEEEDSAKRCVAESGPDKSVGSANKVEESSSKNNSNKEDLN